MQRRLAPADSRPYRKRGFVAAEAMLTMVLVSALFAAATVALGTIQRIRQEGYHRQIALQRLREEADRLRLQPSNGDDSEPRQESRLPHAEWILHRDEISTDDVRWQRFELVLQWSPTKVQPPYRVSTIVLRPMSSTPDAAGVALE